jgi:hypothetical protein
MTDIDRLLDALREADAAEHPPGRVDAAVMAAWDAARTTGPPRRRQPSVAPWLAAAAVVLLGAALGYEQLAVGIGAPPLPSTPVRAGLLLPAALAPAAGESPGPTRSPSLAAVVSTSRDPGRRPARRPTTPAAVPHTLVMVGEPLTAGELVRIVRMRVAPARLAALGISSATMEKMDAVDLELLVGEDGVARAIRMGM